ncbi:MAG: RidA family protein [bacterium]
MKEIIKTDGAPAAIGPYSQAVRCGNMLFCSGQIPLDPKTGETVGITAAEQARQVLDNLSAVIRQAGGSMANVVKTTLFLADMDDFAAVNEVYGSYFDQEPPARSTVEVARLPKDVKVKIDAIAVL